jgi:hypothetical protein
MRKVNVAIASPGDVPDERDVVTEVFNRFNDVSETVFLHPVMWEHSATPSAGGHPQELLNQSIIDRSDLLVAILWSKLGTPTPTAASGTVEEIREFIKHKGPRRVMLYFCTRGYPNDVSLDDLQKLRVFKSEMQSQALYHEFKTVDDFARDVAQHLQVKVRELVEDKLPLPPKQVDETSREDPKRSAIGDPRLKETLDFGTTPQNIADNFSARMDRFNSLSAGPDKFLELGAHLYTSAATALDRYLTYSAIDLDATNREVIRNLSSDLKRLASSVRSYGSKPYPLYWDEGTKVAKDLAAHVDHLRRLKKI